MKDNQHTIPAKDVAEDCKGLEVVFTYNGKERHGLIHEVNKTHLVLDVLTDGLETTPIGESKFKSFRYDRFESDLEVNANIRELYEERIFG